MIDKIVRVAVNNNFNCTDAEFQQLETYISAYPDTVFFVNTNVKTLRLTSLNDYPYKAVITLNPDIDIDPEMVKKLSKINPRIISFVRIKYVPDHPEIVSLIKKISKTLPVVITVQRFNGKRNIIKYVPSYRKHYVWSHSRYRDSTFT